MNLRSTLRILGRGLPARPRLVLAAQVALALLLAACGGSTDREAALHVSLAHGADTAEAGGGLGGAVVAGAITLDVRDSPRFVAVRFHVDDPDMAAEPALVVRGRPFRVELDTTTLADGPHTITVTAEVTRGSRPVATERFFVENGAEAESGEPGSNDPTPTRLPEGDAGASGAGTTGEGSDDGGADDEGGGDEGVDPDAPDEGPADADEPVDEPEPNPAPAPSGSDLPAPTLFVSPHGDDGNDGRAETRPVRTVRRAASLVRPGDVVYLRGGVYPIGVEFRTSGTASAPIVWASHPGELAVFDGSGEDPAHSVAKFHVRASWNVFLNLEVRNAPQEGIYVEDAHDNVFRGIVTHGNGYSGIGNVRSDRNLYEDIVTYDNFDDAGGGVGAHADGIAVSSGDANTIRRVVAFDNSDDGIDVWRSTGTRIERVVAYRNGRGSGGEGNGIKAGGAGTWNGTIVRRTVAFGNRGNGFNENDGEGIVFEHNTAYRNGGWDFMGGDSTTRRNNLAPASTSGMWGSHDERNSWNLDIAPAFESEAFGSDAFMVPSREAGIAGAGAGGADLGAIPVGGSFADLVGSRTSSLLSSR